MPWLYNNEVTLPSRSLLDAGCRDVNSCACVAAFDRGGGARLRYSRLMEAANASCLPAAQDERRRDGDLSAGGADEVRRRLEHWDRC